MCQTGLAQVPEVFSQGGGSLQGLGAALLPAGGTAFGKGLPNVAIKKQ